MMVAEIISTIVPVLAAAIVMNVVTVQEEAVVEAIKGRHIEPTPPSYLTFECQGFIIRSEAIKDICGVQ